MLFVGARVKRAPLTEWILGRNGLSSWTWRLSPLRLRICLRDSRRWVCLLLLLYRSPSWTLKMIVINQFLHIENIASGNVWNRLYIYIFFFGWRATSAKRRRFSMTLRITFNIPQNKITSFLRLFYCSLAAEKNGVQLHFRRRSLPQDGPL